MLREALADFNRAEGEYDNYIRSTWATDPDADEMTMQLMGCIISYGETLAETAKRVIADETGVQPE